jgi:hypothetical protein
MKSFRGLEACSFVTITIALRSTLWCGRIVDLKSYGPNEKLRGERGFAIPDISPCALPGDYCHMNNLYVVPFNFSFLKALLNLQEIFAFKFPYPNKMNQLLPS